MLMLEPERERVARAARCLAGEGLVLGTAGNVSERAGDLIAVTPGGAALASLDPGDVVIVDLEGNQLEGAGAPTSEIDLHVGVYRRYGAGGVIHMHAPFATALACVIDELPAVHYQLLGLGGPIRVAPYATFGSPELARLTLDALEGRSAALMANHGAVVHGPDLDSALENSQLLEWTCTMYWRAAAIGAPRALDHDQLAAVASAAARLGYAGLSAAP
jgi:L-fuculose-phosphate aldolase